MDNYRLERQLLSYDELMSLTLALEVVAGRLGLQERHTGYSQEIFNN